MSWEEYERLCWQAMLEDARASAPPVTRAQWELAHPLTTGRDTYGIRGIRVHHSLAAQKRTNSANRKEPAA